MLSRVAENLYWMSRYVERAENVARLLDVGFFLDLDAVGLADEGQGPVESIMTILACRPGYKKAHGVGDRDSALRFLTFDREGGHSLLGLIARARENARGTQQELSAEAWSQLNQLYLYLSGPRAQKRFAASPSRFYEGIKRACILFDGLIDSTLPRTECFHFLQLGRHLERVNQISRILDAKCRALRDGEGGAEPAAPFRPLGEPPAELFRIRRLSARVSGSRGRRERRPLPGPRRRLPTRRALLRGQVPRVAPRDRRRRG